MARWPMLLCLLALPRAAIAQEAQIVVVRVPEGTRAELSHTYGDALATLRVRRAPPELLPELNRQRGPLFGGARRVGRVGEVLTLAVDLPEPRVNLELRTLRHPRSLSLELTRRVEPPPVPRDRLLGFAAGVLPGLRAPAPFPPPARTDPCENLPLRLSDVEALEESRDMERALELRVDAVHLECRAQLVSLVAERVVAKDADPEKVGRWAFAMRLDRPWPRHLEAYGRARLIAAEILVRRRMFPEAEVMLTALERGAPQLRPYVVLARGRVASARGRPEEAREQLLALWRRAERPRERLLAAFGLTALAIAAERLDEARQVAEEANVDARRASRREMFGLEALWLLGGEAALGLGELQSARRLFSRIERESGANGALARLRLGDLALRLGAPLVDVRRYYAAVEHSGSCLEQILELRQRALAPRPPEGADAAALVEKIAASPACGGAEVDARVLAAELALAQGDTARAFLHVLRLEELHEAYFPAPPMSALVRRVKNAHLAFLIRHGRSEELLLAFEERLNARPADLDAAVLLAVLEAYLELGLTDRAVGLCLSLLRGTGPAKSEDLSVLLARAYAEQKDAFRIDLVARYFLQKSPRSPRAWEVRRWWARALVDSGAPEAALFELDRAGRAPSGDPQADLLLLRAEAELTRGATQAAARELIRSLEAAPDRPFPRGGLPVRVLSACALGCEPAALAELVRAVGAAGGDGLLDTRLRSLVEARTGPLPETGTSTLGDEARALWRELRRLTLVEDRQDVTDATAPRRGATGRRVPDARHDEPEPTSRAEN